MSSGRRLQPSASPSMSTNVMNNASNINMKDVDVKIAGRDIRSTTIINPTPRMPETSIHPDPRMQLILSHSALDALLNSRERSDPPRCSPDTREALLQSVIDWIKSPIQSPRVKWIKGSAGSGKTAIAQTVAEGMKEMKFPTACFFFSRTSGLPMRMDGYCLIPTIIHQLCLLFPEHRSAVLKKIRKDGSVFDQTLKSQAEALLIKPLQQFSFRRWLRALRSSHILPLLIVIDGLDECRDTTVQRDILRMLADAASALRHVPVRFLIASRPEGHITREFNQYIGFQGVDLGIINLDDDLDASRAIRAFISQQFELIRERHPVGFGLDPSWPGDEVIDFLMAKSSPQFILASTAMRFISMADEQPKKQLQKIIDLFNTQTSTSGSKEQPLETLDNLYKLIFESVKVEHRDLIQAFLGIIHLSSLAEYSLQPPTAQFLEILLALDYGDVHLRMEPLASVIEVPKYMNEPLRSLHTSLFDFLLNPMRSHGQKLQLHHAQAALVGHYAHINLEEAQRLAELHDVQSSPILSMSLRGSILQPLRSIPEMHSWRHLETQLSHIQMYLDWLFRYDIGPSAQWLGSKTIGEVGSYLVITGPMFERVDDRSFLVKQRLYRNLLVGNLPCFLIEKDKTYLLLGQHKIPALHFIISILEFLISQSARFHLDWPYGDCALPDHLLSQESEEVRVLVGICHELIFLNPRPLSYNATGVPHYMIEYAEFCRIAWVHLFDPEPPKASSCNGWISDLDLH